VSLVFMLAILALALGQIGLVAPAWFQTRNIRKRGVDVDPRRDPLQRSGEPDPVGASGSLHGWVLDSENGDGSQRSLIFRALLLNRCPSAVCRAVVGIGINSIKRVIDWARSHVGKELLERLPPLFAYPYAAPSPVRVVLAAGVVAAPFHLKPCAVLVRHRAAAFMTVLRHSLGSLCHELTIGAKCPRPLRRKATARLDAAVSQVGAGHQLRRAAIAQATPHSRLVVFLQNDQSAKPLAGDFN
jgi:hypothetical protein